MIFDEAERGGKTAENRINDILELIMSASAGGGHIVKGTAAQGSSSKDVCACFCLASINVAARNRIAVARRISILELTKSSNPDQALARWKDLKPKLEQIPDGERLIARTLKHFKILRRNIEIFKTAIAEHLHDQTMGDQMGPLMAGAYLLRTRVSSPKRRRASL